MSEIEGKNGQDSATKIGGQIEVLTYQQLPGLPTRLKPVGFCEIGDFWGFTDLSQVKPEETVRLDGDFSPREEAAAYLLVIPRSRNNTSHFLYDRLEVSRLIFGPEPVTRWGMVEATTPHISKEIAGMYPNLARLIRSPFKPTVTNLEEVKNDLEDRSKALWSLQESVAEKYLGWINWPNKELVHLANYEIWLEDVYPDLTPDQIARLITRQTTPYLLRNPQAVNVDRTVGAFEEQTPFVRLAASIYQPAEDQAGVTASNSSKERDKILKKDLSPLEMAAAKTRFALTEDQTNFAYQTPKKRAEAIISGLIDRDTTKRFKNWPIHLLSAKLGEADLSLLVKLDEYFKNPALAKSGVKELADWINNQTSFGRLRPDQIFQIVMGQASFKEITSSGKS